MKLVFVYLGPTRVAPGLVLEVLPRLTLATRAEDGYFAVAWLLWAIELQWKYSA